MNENLKPVPLPEAQATTEETSSVQAPSEETEGNLEFEEVDFSALVDPVDDEVVEPATELEEVVVPEVTAKGDEPVSEAPDEVEAKPEETPALEEEPAPETPVSESEEEEISGVKIPTKEELQGMYDDFRKEALPALEKQYEMDDELAAAYDENPKEVLPKIAARLHYNSMMSSYNAMSAALPSIVQSVIQASNLATKASNQFYDAWPQLREVDEKIVQTAVRSYRQANPTAKLDKVIQSAGTLAMINAGLEIKPPEPEKPAARRRAPAKPAAPGGAPPTPPAKPKGDDEENVFGDLSEAFTESQFQR
jgi:hypothetical protein